MNRTTASKPAKRRVRRRGPLTKTSLGEAVAAELGVSPKEAARILEAVCDVIARTVTAGHNVSITNFGTWVSTRTPKRKARNPQTGGTVTVPARQVVRFRTAPRLAAIVRDGKVTAATIRKRPKTPKTPA